MLDMNSLFLGKQGIWAAQQGIRAKDIGVPCGPQRYVVRRSKGRGAKMPNDRPVPISCQGPFRLAPARHCQWVLLSPARYRQVLQFGKAQCVFPSANDAIQLSPGQRRGIPSRGRGLVGMVRRLDIDGGGQEI
jgi:hypothetical protein